MLPTLSNKKILRYATVAETKRCSKIEGLHETINLMGNCIKSIDPLMESIPRSIGIDASPIQESHLPIIFLVGGPAVGKSTVCDMIAKKYGFLSIITADIVRREVSRRDDRAIVLARLMSQGRLVPTDVLLELIIMKMLNHLQQTKGFIVAGFPRKIDQCRLFDREVRPPDLVIFLDVRNSVLVDRTMARFITTTERIPYDFDVYKKRIKQFYKNIQPIVKHYRHHTLVVIDAEPDVSAVCEEIYKAVDNVLERIAIAHTESSATDS